MKTFERVALVVALVLGLLGLLLPAQVAPVAPVTSSQGLTFGTSNFGGSIAVAGDATIAGAVSGGSLSGGSILVGGIVSGASLTINGVAQSGAIRYGTQSVISGTTIAHGIGTTPTMFVVSDEGPHGTTYTQTLYHHACNVTSCTIGITQGSITTTVIDWVAGR